MLDTAADVVRHLLLGQRHRLDHGEDGRLDACEKFLVNEFAPHIKAFDSYPGINLTQGNYALSQVWNGDARQGLLRSRTPAAIPSKYKWGLGAPPTELWMDNWCILKGAKNLDAAYDFINFILDARELGEGSRVPRLQHRHQGHRGPVADDLKFPEMIFFDAGRCKTMDAGA